MRREWRPFRDIRFGKRHIHHFVPGILLAFTSGTVAMLTEDDALEEALAIPMGAGIGLTFDEAALLLDLRDVYWTRQGLLSVQLSLGATAILSIAILTLRMLRRGERRQEIAGQIPLPPHADRPRLSRRDFFSPSLRGGRCQSRRALVCLATGVTGGDFPAATPP